MKTKTSIQEFIYAVVLLAAMVLLFFRFSMQTISRAEAQNKDYAADSAHLKSVQIDEELNNALRQISAYAYFAGESMTEPVITARTLAKIEESAYFDAIMFTDLEGVDHASDGRTADVTERWFYRDGISGNSGIEAVFAPHFFDETMACFYAPVYSNGEIVGVLRGAFLAEEYLKSMLATTYFGEEAQVFLCTPDGRVVASSEGSAYEGHLLDTLTAADMIDPATGSQVREIFDAGGTGAFVCGGSSKTDNICAAYLPDNNFVFVQTFPKNVTQSMIAAGTRPADEDVSASGSYQELLDYFNIATAENTRQEFVDFMDKNAIIAALSKQNDLRYERQIIRAVHSEWEHINVVCLERKDDQAVKALFTRQNITGLKEKELRVQAERALASRKERQYQIAIMSNSFCNCELNLTQNRIEQDIIGTIDGQSVSFLEQVGLTSPCKASEYFEKWKQFVMTESVEHYSAVVNTESLLKRFEQGDREVIAKYWSQGFGPEPVCVRQSFAMTKDETTGDIMAMVVSKDITEQVGKQREQTQALQDALMQAQHANAAKTTFLSNMCNDIRTPINAIIGFSTIAASHIDNRDQVLDCLQKVFASSNHLLSLINDILDMSRIESGKVQIKEQECSISELIHNLVNIVQPQVKAKQLDLFIDTFEVINEDVIADPLKLNQVFINLLSNAVKYTPAEGMLSFRIMQKSTFRHGYGHYIFIIKDNGIGMSPDFVKHIFEPFERESTVTQSGIQGTGLGMAITKNIVEMMNGTIHVESELGKGSVFTVEFELKLQDTEKAAEQIKELKGMRALVVDDDFNACDSACRMPKQLGLRPEWTTSGREAAYRAKNALEEGDAYRTFILDWQMPGPSGLETAKKIRATVGNDAPIIILTAYDWSDIEGEAKAAGITAFCAKPMFMSDLKTVLLAANNLVEKQETVPKWTLADFSGKRILLVEDNALEEDTENAFKNGMNAHIAKPLDMGIFISVLRKFLE